MMMPAKQGFEADDVAVAKVDLCLIEWEDPVVAEGLARLAQHGFSAFCSLAHFGAKFADDPRALRLRRIERQVCALEDLFGIGAIGWPHGSAGRSEEHTSELQSLMRISYAACCLKKKIK